MLRHLLTMLALITGLAASAAPVVVRAERADGAQVQQAGETVAVAAAQVIALRENRETSEVERAEPAPGRPIAGTDFDAPAVRIGADRAHE